MKKQLRKRNKTTQKSLELYATCYCLCGGCSGCGSVPASDYVNVYDNRGMNASYSRYLTSTIV